MKDKRILFVSSEVVPYLPETELSSTSFMAAKNAHSKGVQTRIFMPRFGVINERRHQLHEVIRLSGMNLVVNDVDMPLIIKVASVQGDRMQVYFLDNEDFFKRKATFEDADGNAFEYNPDRMIFFCKGVLETVRKLGWSPDIIHVHGWLASLLPLYLKEYYKEEPLFTDSKIVTSLYNDEFKGELNKELINKVKFDKIDNDSVAHLANPTQENILKNAILNSDAIIKGSSNYSDDLEQFIDGNDVTVLDYQSEEYLTEAYLDFYKANVLELQDS